MFNPDGSFITQIKGEATLSSWGRERVLIDPITVKGRMAATDLEEREKAFHGPVAVEVDDEGRIFVVEVARQRLQVFRKQTFLYQGGLL